MKKKNNRKVGKPLRYPTPESLQTAIVEYFNNTPFDKYTVTGLALVVGGKQLLEDYQKREGYSSIVNMAKLKVENSYEVSLREKGGAGNIFALKNFGWQDNIEFKGDGGGRNIIQIITGHKPKEESNGEKKEDNGLGVHRVGSNGGNGNGHHKSVPAIHDSEADDGA